MCPEFHARDILQADNRAIGIFANYDLAKFLRRNEPALGGDGVGEFLAFRRRRAADLADGIDIVLRVDGGEDVANGQVQRREVLGLDPKAHRVLAGAENIDVGNPLQLRDLVDQIDVGVIGEKCRVERTIRR